MKLRVTNDDNLMRQHSVSRRKIANQSDVSKGTYALEALLTHTRIWKQQKSQESSRLVWSLSLATLTQHHFICMHQCCTLSIFPITSSFFQSSRKQRIASNLAFVLLRIRNKLARFQFMLHTFGHGQTTVLVGALTRKIVRSLAVNLTTYTSVYKCLVLELVFYDIWRPSFWLVSKLSIDTVATLLKTFFQVVKKEYTNY